MPAIDQQHLHTQGELSSATAVTWSLSSLRKQEEKLSQSDTLKAEFLSFFIPILQYDFHTLDESLSRKRK